jgi:hypothetical protein
VLVAEIGEEPGARLGVGGVGRGERELEGLDGAAPVPEERPQRGDPRVGGEAGAERHHARRRVGGAAIVAELRARVGEVAVVPPVVRRDPACGARRAERRREAVLPEEHPGTGPERAVVAGVARERPRDRRAGALVVRRIAGLARLPHEGRAELDQRIRGRAALDPALGLGDRAVGRARGGGRQHGQEPGERQHCCQRSTGLPGGGCVGRAHSPGSRWRRLRPS